MIFRHFLSPKTGCASYLFGCAGAACCAVVDPQLDIEPYLEAAEQKSMRITHIFETHVQADHLSGARRLADATGAPVIFHKSAPVGFPHVDVEDGARHDLGNLSPAIPLSP